MTEKLQNRALDKQFFYAELIGEIHKSLYSGSSKKFKLLVLISTVWIF